MSYPSYNPKACIALIFHHKLLSFLGYGISVLSREAEHIELWK